ncbi:hypothetical protein HanRHA438_Chr05g0209221 [Helianthus annuus]|nr:hypothetical protein HanRHA438_Chr05g0209221 [Helianthus annuus]
MTIMVPVVTTCRCPLTPAPPALPNIVTEHRCHHHQPSSTATRIHHRRHHTSAPPSPTLAPPQPPLPPSATEHRRHPAHHHCCHYCYRPPPPSTTTTTLPILFLFLFLSTKHYKVGMSSVPSGTNGTGTERTGTENPQKWVPIPNIPGSVWFGTGSVRYRYLRVKTGKYRYRTGTVPDRYRKC